MLSKNNCSLIQNSELLLEEIPIELKNLTYGVYPNDVEYNDLRFIYNKRFNLFTHAIYYPNNENDIAYLIKNFTLYNLKFSIRCGGHSYEPASLSEGFIIDVKKFSNIDIDLEKKKVKVGSGVRLGNLITTLSNNDLIAVTGESSCVGVSGLCLAGGKGPLSRPYGMACDNIISVKLVNYKGEIILANSKTNCDLYWAIKGSGVCNYGVVFEIELNIYDDIYSQITTLTWNWNPIENKIILQLYSKWIIFTEKNKNITSDLKIIYNNGTANLSITFYKYNNTIFSEIDEFKKLFNPTINKCEGYYSKITNCWVSYDTGKNMPFSKMKSTMIYQNIDDKCIDGIINSINNLLEKKYNLTYQYNFTQLGGKVKKGNSCYYPKKYLITLTIFITWTLQELEAFSLDFINKVYKNIVPYTSKYLFPNMVDYDIKDYMTAYYGSNKKRLIEIKTKYDPNNIFNWRQSIPVNNKK